MPAALFVTLLPLVAVGSDAYAQVPYPSKTVKELIAVARARPGVLTFGSSGNGSAFHLAGELFKSMSKVDLLHVPYKGGNLALNDLLGTPEIRDLWASQGMEVVTNTPEQFAQRLRGDFEKYGRIVKTVGIEPE